jgi:glycyl-tRNA synthetase beta subunit
MIFKNAISSFRKKKINSKEILNDIMQFFMSRLEYFYKQNNDSVSYKAVLAIKKTHTYLALIDKKINMLDDFIKKENSSQLIISIKRIANISSSLPDKRIIHLNQKAFLTKYEKNLLADYKKLRLLYNKEIGKKWNYEKFLNELPKICRSIDEFLDNVNISDLKPKHKSYVLALINKINKLFNTFADFSVFFNKV